MNYRKVIAFIPDLSVLFELDDGNYALVSWDDDKTQITISKYAESHLKFGGFEDGKIIPEKMFNIAVEILEKEENVFICQDIKRNNN